ncbi:MAG TPA: 7TM diverse intracellular signaling domain-containing protein, partial [Dongiaceae bacterium]|nr:7TM diverse intracellular signaling domain-containing protein [Dongiaceae bacterium]
MGARLLLPLILLMLGCANAVAAIPVVDVRETGRQFAIQAQTRFLEDHAGTLQPEALLRGEQDQNLRDNQGRSFSFGISASTYWLMFELGYNSADESTAAQLQRLLEVSYPPLDQISLYYFDRDGRLQQIDSGDTRPFKNRPVVHNGYVFPLDLNPGESRRFLLRVNSEGSIRVPMTLWEPDYFHEQNRSMMLLHGIYFGIVVLMFLYNLILFLFIRDQTYLYYIVYIASLLFFQANYSGFAFQYLWPEQPQANNLALLSSIWMVLIFAPQFARRVLDSYATLPRLDRVVRQLIAVAIVLLLASPFLHYHLVLYAAVMMAMVEIIAIVAAAILNSARGLRTARLFLLAWSAFLLGAGILGGVAVGLLPANSFTSHALILGSAIEVTLLSLSLADRMNRIERERTLAEQEAKNALLAVNRSLMENNKLKDEFLNTISHEMRTPMHGVLSSINHLRNHDDIGKREQFVDSAERSARHMMMLIDSVLNYNELHSSSFKLERETFTLTRLTSALDELFRGQAEAKGLQFDIVIQPDVPDLLIGDFRRTQQILANLLSNAVKFTQQGFV